MRRLALSCLLTTLALAAAGCNRGETVQVEGARVALRTSDYRIEPQRVRVRPGRVTFAVRNGGTNPHNWVLTRRGRERGRIRTMLPGESGTLTLRLRRGTYRMACTVTHHQVLGEYGTVSVR